MNTEYNKNEIKKESVIKRIMSSLGPGFIIAATVFGGGSIITASKAGSIAGYSYLWAIILAAIFMVSFTRMSATIGCVSEKTMLEEIEVNYSRLLAILFSFCCFLICAGFQSGNNINIGVALNALFPAINVKVWIIVSYLVILLLIWKSRSFYEILEKIMTILVLIMILCFMGNILFFIPQIKGGQLIRGVLPGKVENWQLIVSMSATTFSIVGAACQSYLVQGKGWSKSNLQKAKRDSSVGIIVLTAITAILLITAATLIPKGSDITNVPSIALLLKPLLGNFANIMFLIGFFAAVFSSAIANAVIGGTFIADGLKLGKNINDFWVKMFSSFIITLGMGVGLIFGSNPMQLTIMAQGATIVGAPLIAVTLLLLGNNKKVVGENKNGLIMNIIGCVAVAWLTFLSINQILLWCGISIL